MTDDPRNIFVNQRYGEEPKEQPQGNHDTHPKSTSDDYESKLAEMQRLAEKYQREGEGQLVKDIIANVLEQKARGKLTNRQLTEFAGRVSPLLNAEQKQRLNSLLEELLKL